MLVIEIGNCLPSKTTFDGESGIIIEATRDEIAAIKENVLYNEVVIRRKDAVDVRIEEEELSKLNAKIATLEAENGKLKQENQDLLNVNKQAYSCISSIESAFKDTGWDGQLPPDIRRTVFDLIEEYRCPGYMKRKAEMAKRNPQFGKPDPERNIKHKEEK